LWGSRGVVAEAFGDAWAAAAQASIAEAGAAPAAAAFAWYQRAMQASDGTATVGVIDKAARAQGGNAAGDAGSAAARGITKAALERWVGPRTPPM
ncbi:MAG TPA: hypothetical protein VFJ62_01005, partial [Usitatibacter sp.]|nr:hypothetical protein [Usitatibacter sp.]